MKTEDVVWPYRTLETVGIRVWIDGGWCIDALMGYQTREHSDVDIAIAIEDSTALHHLMASHAFYKASHPAPSGWNHVYQDQANRRLDVHLFALDQDGNGILGPPELGYSYPAGALSGSGLIGDCRVQCIAPEYVVQFKTSFEPCPIDAMDVVAICNKFGIPNPL
jgi:lincosamide nucleotidyltransferase A/C/D/E